MSNQTTNPTVPQIHKQLMRYGNNDLARLEYGRLMWKNPKNRERLLRHWSDERHPYQNRFQTHQNDVEWVLTADPSQDDQLNQNLAKKGSSLRAVIREIPPVFGSFYKDSAIPSPLEKIRREKIKQRHSDQAAIQIAKNKSSQSLQKVRDQLQQENSLFQKSDFGGKDQIQRVIENVIKQTNTPRHANLDLSKISK